MNNTQTNEKYLRQNGYDLNDAVDISNIRTQQQKDIFRNARLGSYNKYGRYIIPPAVIKELLFMKKYVYQDSYNDVIRQNKDTYEFNVEGFLPVFGNINFKLAVKGHSAHLYLLENVYREFNGYQEIFGEQISSAVCDDTKTNNIEYLFTTFNIKVVDKEDIEGKKPEELAEDSEKIQSIMYTKMHLALVSKEYLKVSASDEKETFDDLVAMLKDEGGEYGKKVLKHFIDRIEKRPDIMQIKDEDGYNESLNDILVGAVEVATTEDDMQDPHTKDLYRRIYDRRFEDTGKHFSEAEDKVPRKTTDQVVDKLLHINRGHLEENEELDTFRTVLDSIAKEDNKPEQIGAALTIDKIRRDLTEAILKTRTTDQSQEGPDLEAAAAGKNLEELKGQGQGEETAKGAVVDPKKEGKAISPEKKAETPYKIPLYDHGKFKYQKEDNKPKTKEADTKVTLTMGEAYPAQDLRDFEEGSYEDVEEKLSKTELYNLAKEKAQAIKDSKAKVELHAFGNTLEVEGTLEEDVDIIALEEDEEDMVVYEGDEYVDDNNQVDTNKDAFVLGSNELKKRVNVVNNDFKQEQDQGRGYGE